MTYREALLRSRLTKSEIANYFNVTLQTVERWYRINKTPTGVIPALRLISGDCPTFSKKDLFSGWSFSNGFLWSPELDSFSSGDIRASKLDYEIIRGYERELAELRQRLKPNKPVFSTAKIYQFPVVNRIVSSVDEKTVS